MNGHCGKFILCEVVNLLVSEREYLCKNYGKNNYGEGCRFHGLLKLHYTLFCFFFVQFLRENLLRLGHLLDFELGVAMIYHRI
jgi:hypothetical protein